MSRNATSSGVTLRLVTPRSGESLPACLRSGRITAEVNATNPASIVRTTGNSTNRTYDHLQLMMHLTVRYFRALQWSHGAAHDANRARVSDLLDRAERTHKSWLNALKVAKLGPSPYERWFYAAYRDERRRWLAR